MLNFLRVFKKNKELKEENENLNFQIKVLLECQKVMEDELKDVQETGFELQKEIIALKKNKKAKTTKALKTNTKSSKIAKKIQKGAK